ncbi:MAG: RHS repeat-associated core domain-containing protein [Saprospiraceae bacterium]|nr:RHS repeat-associated core domain-containing protein [Saprospiraceae bacterium]
MGKNAVGHSKIKVAGWATPYTFTGKEKDDLTGLQYFGARYYDSRISIWYGVDPKAEKYPSLSPYCFVANNPIRYIDPDGREIVDPQGRRAIIYDKKGRMHFTKYATADIRRVAGALSLTTEGTAQLKRINSSDIKTKINVSSDSKIETRADGKTSYTYGETEQGNKNNPPSYSKFQNEDGSFGIKEATITIFKGTLKEGIKPDQV